MEKKYANGFSLSVNPADARILYTISTPILENGKDTGRVEIENVADIRMSPIMLKQLKNVIVDSVKRYEDAFGEIKLLADNNENE